jgi:hypothetical protein
MFRKRKTKNAEGKSEGAQRSSADLLRDALSEIGDGKQEMDRRYRSKQKHVDDYEEVVIDPSEREPLSDALMKLTGETHSNRHRLLPEERPSVKLPSDTRKGKGGREEAQQTADEAAKEFRDELRKHGIPERTHYYPATERQQTGEVDRTYRVPRPKGKKRDEQQER